MAVTITLKREQVSFWALRFKGFLAPSRLTAVATRRWHTLLLRYFRANVATRHATANRLGATPTAHWSNPELGSTPNCPATELGVPLRQV